MNPASSTAPATAACRVSFGGRPNGTASTGGTPRLGLALPVLAGAAEETLSAGTADPVLRDGCTLFSATEGLSGFASATPGMELEAATEDLYRRLLTVTRGRHLYRVWNYVPHINAIEHGLENYRRFCRARSLVFERHYGPDFQQRLSAASAVGLSGGTLALAFVAGRTEPRHFENPRQLPAFEYPPYYGPRPPSFARATLVRANPGRRIFISGTAAIHGHATVAAGDIGGQLECTLANLKIIAATAEATLTGGPGWCRFFKVYLRQASDLPLVTARLERELHCTDDEVTYLQADLCRSNLLVEIEATLTADF